MAKEDFKINVKERDFNEDDALKSSLVTAEDLCVKIIGRFFKSFTSEFEGCELRPVAVGTGVVFEVLAYFVPKNESDVVGIKVVQDVSKKNENKSSTTLKTLANLSNISSGTRYELNELVKREFSRLMFGAPTEAPNKENNFLPPRKVDWKNDVVEVKDSLGTMGVRNSIAMVRVRFDLIRLIEKIYGTKVKLANGAEGGKAEYNAYIIGNANNADTRFYSNNLLMPGQAYPRNFIVSINQLDVEKVKKLASRAGYGAMEQSGSILMFKPE